MGRYTRIEAEDLPANYEAEEAVLGGILIDPGMMVEVAAILDGPENFGREKNGWILIGVYSEEENLGIGEILSSDQSALDAFIERKLKEGGISLQEESRVTVIVNPDPAYEIKPNERAIIIP